MLIDQLTLLVIEIFGVRLRKLFECVENRHTDSGAGLLLLSPVQEDAFGFVEFDIRAVEQIEDGEFKGRAGSSFTSAGCKRLTSTTSPRCSRPTVPFAPKVLS